MTKESGDIVFEDLFGNQNTEKILFKLIIDEKCYAQELANNFATAIYGFQRTLKKLEKANVLINYTEGRTRVYQFNPRYPFLKELKQFIEKAYTTLPDTIKDQYYEPKIRKRPRRTGKPI